MPYKKLFPQLFSPTDTLRILDGGLQPALNPSFDILVWNMYKGKGQGWEEEFAGLVTGKELVFLQESVLGAGFNAVFAGNDGFEWVMAQAHQSRRTRLSTGVKTGAVTKSMGQSFFASPDVEPILRTPKMLLATSYRIKGLDKPLLAVNVHAINYVTLEKFGRQMAQVMDVIKNHDGPVILAGDFNTWNTTRYNNLLTLTKEAGLTEAALTRKGRWLHLNRHLDHVFYKGLRVENAQVQTAIRSSDHFPITMRFSISM